MADIFGCCLINDAEELKNLIQSGVDANMTFCENTSLHHASFNNSIECIKLLLEAGGDKYINAKDAFGHTPLHLAALSSSKESLLLLLEFGGKEYVNVKDNNGNTPLHAAAFDNSKDCLLLLLDAGAGIYAKNNEGNTPLEYIKDENLKKEIEEYAIVCSALHIIKEPSC